MTRSVLALAALTTVAIPGIDIYQAKSLAAPEGFEAALVLDSESRQWVVRAPLNAAAGAALQAETALLSTLEPYVESGALPFVVPQPKGYAPLDEGGRAVIYPHVMGNPLTLARLTPGPGASASLGRAIGAIHSLPIKTLEDTGLPVYTAEQYRTRRLAELDEGAATGHVPVPLLKRWESALENVALWRFQPVVTHTLLSEDSIIMSHGQVSGITDWSGARVGDPADDLAWLVAGAPEDCVDSIFEAYQLRRKDSLDPHLIDRALLGSELALLSWLLHGTRTGNHEVIEDAQGMLADLMEATGATDGFTLSTDADREKRSKRVRIIGETGEIGHVNLDETQPVEVASARTEVVAGETITTSPSASSPAAASPDSQDLDAPDSDAQDPNAQDTNAQGPGLEFVEVPDDAEPTSWSLGVDSTPVRERLEDLNAEPTSVAESEDFNLPDYSHARPPRPYADDPTQMLEALADPDAHDEASGTHEA